MTLVRKERPCILVITYHFPPDGSVGGLRWAGLTKYLARRGWDVEVITASAQDDREADPGVQVHHHARRRTLNDLYNAWIGRRRVRAQGAGGLATSADTAESGRTGSGVIASLRRSISIALAFPDFGRGWVLRAAWAARGRLRSRRFSAVISSGPPHSAHLASALACLGRRETRLVDMRDPWALMVEKSPDSPGIARHWIDRLIPYLEQLVLRRAHTVMANTEEFARVLDGRKANLRVCYLPNGVDLERLPSAPAAKYPGLSISYAGTMYLGRDLTPVVRALRAFVDTHPEARGAVKLHVAGSMDSDHEARFLSEVAATDLCDAVEMRGRIAPAEALDMISRSHLTLVLAQDQPVQIPAKLYECVALGVPTLVIAESTSAAAREARRIGALTHEPSDTDGMFRLIESLWSNPGTSIQPTAPIGYHAIAEQLESLLLQSHEKRAVATELRHGGVGAR